MEIDMWNLLKWILIILVGVAIIYAVYWLIIGLWWVWYTTISWFIGLFGFTITGWQALALLIFWIIFFPGLRIVKGSNLININYKPKQPV